MNSDSALPNDFPPAARLGVKICGFTRADQAEAAVSAGADALGINLWPRSKRFLPLDEAARWLPALRERTCLAAVVVNPPAALLDELVSSNLFHLIQLHGDETPEATARLMDRGVRVIKALPVSSEESLTAAGTYPCRDILLDASNPGTYGGGGTAFPWHLAARANKLFPEKRFILSGGLNPANVAQAIAEARPAAVDVASGVESAPGIKDPDQVHAFIQNARLAAQ